MKEYMTSRHSGLLIRATNANPPKRLWLVVKFLIFQGGIYSAMKFALFIDWPVMYVINEVLAMPYRILRFIFIGDDAHLITRTFADGQD